MASSLPPVGSLLCAAVEAPQRQRASCGPWWRAILNS